MDESSQLARRNFVKRALVITAGGGLIKFGFTRPFLPGPLSNLSQANDGGEEIRGVPAAEARRELKRFIRQQSIGSESFPTA